MSNESWNASGIRKELSNRTRDFLQKQNRTVSDEEVLEWIEKAIWEIPELEFCPLDEKAVLANRVFLEIRRELGILEPLEQDHSISEIMVNGTGPIYVERNGKLEAIPEHFDTTDEIEEIARRLAAKVHREFNDLNPIVDARMEDGSRFHAVGKNVAIGGPIINIRKFPESRIRENDLLENSTISFDAMRFLKDAVRGGLNIFVSGGTSSGKTTFLNVLTDSIPENERVIVLEDSSELQIDHLNNVVRMETKESNSREKGAVTMSDLIRSSLRMRPDRIIVGEVRGSEVIDMIQAMNTGHDGSLSTGHGNSPEGMLARLEALYLSSVDFPLDAVRSQIGEAIDLICHLGRLPDGKRKVLEIAEIEGVQNNKYIINEIFKYNLNETLEQVSQMHTKNKKAEQRGIYISDSLYSANPYEEEYY